ncbi:MAG: diguanylate cyclase [Sandaracinaceae bacterium]|nr:diguanylate cyclase [Sandaracinaceae bacterium]
MGEGWKTMRIEALKTDESLPRDRCMLTMISGPTPGAIQPVSGHELVLGRGEDLEARIDDRGMSRRHSRIFKVEQHFYLEDLGSTNGTHVNGVKLTTRHRLADGDRIQVGESTVLRVSLQDAREAEAARKLYESAVLDPLTHVHNRGAFDERFRTEFAFASRHSVPLTVMMIDLDFFKKINDTRGHQAGDAVLQSVGACLKSAIRAEDMIARYGGEEFVLLARGIEKVPSLQLAERIRATIEALAIPWEGGDLKVTSSIGVAVLEPSQALEHPEQLLSIADHAVYRAKNQGRNRVCSGDALQRSL